MVRQLFAAEADCEGANSWRLSADHKSRRSSSLKDDFDRASLYLSRVLGHGEYERDMKLGL